MLKKVALSIGILLSSFSLSACEGVKETLGIANRQPVIASFDYSPKSGLTKNDVITFSVVSNDPEGRPLQYNWTATKGILTANSGSTVSWRPIKLDSSFESGLTSVSVLVSDGVMTNTASVNIFINGENITVDSKPVISTLPLVTPSVSPSVSVAPSASPIPTPVATVTAAPTASAPPISTATPTVTPAATSTPASTSATLSPSPTTTPIVVVSPTPTATPVLQVASPTPSPTATTTSGMLVTQ